MCYSATAGATALTVLSQKSHQQLEVSISEKRTCLLDHFLASLTKVVDVWTKFARVFFHLVEVLFNVFQWLEVKSGAGACINRSFVRGAAETTLQLVTDKGTENTARPGFVATPQIGPESGTDSGDGQMI